jgi:hypothetical protein
VIVWLQLETLLTQSVAVQVRVITFVQVLPGLVSLKSTVRALLQASLAVTVTAGISAAQCTNRLGVGQPLKTGAVVNMVAV